LNISTHHKTFLKLWLFFADFEIIIVKAQARISLMCEGINLIGSIHFEFRFPGTRHSA